MQEPINWYPGHMKKTRALIEDNLKLVDMVIEVLDARIPVSSHNPDIDDLLGAKPRIRLLNKSDLADPLQNEAWSAAWRAAGVMVVTTDCQRGEGLRALTQLLARLQTQRNETHSLQRPLRLMVVGVPNVGKSSLINRLTRSRSTRTGDKPGVTRGKQWLTLENGMQLLDTPGILWPKFEDRQVGLHLAFCGSIRDEILDVTALAMALLACLMRMYPAQLGGRYGLSIETEDPQAVMEGIARRRGCLLSGGRIDYDRCARMILDEFRGGRIGRMTLEPCMAASAADDRADDRKVRFGETEAGGTVGAAKPVPVDEAGTRHVAAERAAGQDAAVASEAGQNAGAVRVAGRDAAAKAAPAAEGDRRLREGTDAAPGSVRA